MTHPGATGPETGPIWASPGEFGQPAATDGRTGIATPLLAGFSIAVLASVGQAPPSFRWPGATIFVLVLAAGLFVFSLQVGFRSRSKLYSREEALSWGRINRLDAELDERVRAEVQRRHMAGWRRAQRRVQLCYNVAITVLAVGIALAAAPPPHYDGTALSGGELGWRWGACALALSFAALELGWMVRDEIRHRRLTVLARQSVDRPAR